MSETTLISIIDDDALTRDGIRDLVESLGYMPVILITAYPNEKQRSLTLNGGAVGVLSKPFNEESLIRCLAAAIKPR